MNQWLDVRAWRWELRDRETIIGVVYAVDTGVYDAFRGPGYEYLGKFGSLNAAKRAVERKAECGSTSHYSA